MDGEAFKRRLVHSVALTNITLYCCMLNSLFANVLKCKARLKTEFKCMYVTMYSLVMSPFSLDYMKMEIKVSSISNVLTDLHVYSIHTAPGF